MDGANFGLLARRWLYAQLATDTALEDAGVTTVSEHPGGKTRAYPLVTYSTVSPFVASTNVSGQTLHAEGAMLVRAIGKTGSYEDLAAAADAINARLSDVNCSQIPGGGLVLTSRFHKAFELADQADGVEYRSLGAVFRLQIQAA